MGARGVCRIWATSTTLLALCCGAAAQDRKDGCPPLSDQAKESVLAYMRKLGNVPAGALLRVIDSNVNERTCYRRLEFVSSDPSARATLFLSPDQRFLTPQVFDLRSDPKQEMNEEEQRIESEISSYLDGRRPPVTNAAKTAITIAVFADFQCLYCAQGLKLLMRDVLPRYKNLVRVAYLHFPLANHPWARPAAELMTCVNLQSPDLFWKLHDDLFDHQTEIRTNNLEARVREKIKLLAPDFDLQRLRECNESKAAVPLVDADMELGWHLQISGTPTMFVNGRRVDGVSSAGAIEAVIDDKLRGDRTDR